MPLSVASLPATPEYAGSQGCVKWEGYRVVDEAAFREFLSGSVAARAADEAVQQSFVAELQALATTGMASEFLGRFLAAVPEEKDWELGEAFAETVLFEDAGREVVWPWNEARDRRTPRASLPGADLVGFCRDSQGFCLLFGEVKTSSDSGSPPQVMYGTRGLTWQLEANATRLDIQHSLLRWLRLRCQSPELEVCYRGAVTRYLTSGGRDILIVGVLLRDTACDERDVRSRAQHLASVLVAPTRVEVLAWYLPLKVEQWPGVLRGGS